MSLAGHMRHSSPFILLLAYICTVHAIGNSLPDLLSQEMRDYIIYMIL
jgi:hypothetical protein